jgi:positive regulator of sigma E activity
MNAQRSGRIEAVGPDVAVVRLLAECSGCGGCGGRCALLAGVVMADQRIALPLNHFDADPGIGQPVRLYLPDASLLEHARRGYGLPLAGLLLGALAGHALARLFSFAPDPLAVLLAAVGTLTGIRASKRAMPPACRAGPAAIAAPGSAAPGHSPTTACNEDQTP